MDPEVVPGGLGKRGFLAKVCGIRSRNYDINPPKIASSTPLPEFTAIYAENRTREILAKLSFYEFVWVPMIFLSFTAQKSKIAVMGRPKTPLNAGRTDERREE